MHLGLPEETIKQTDGRLTQQLDSLAQRLDGLTSKMDNFLEALNRMERRINRMTDSWSTQLKFMESIISNQHQIVATQAKTVDRLLDAVYPKGSS